MAIVTDLYSSLEGYSEWDNEREKRKMKKRPVRREEIVLVAMREQRYVSEPIETKYSNFWLLILLGSNGI